jgi:predicted transcriptional regulator YdeE
MELGGIVLLGLSLGRTTSNAEGQSAIDCGNLWHKFKTEDYQDRILGKTSEQIFAVYHDYESNSSGQFRYFIGCQVSDDAQIQDGLELLVIPRGTYERFVAKGRMPDSISEAWKVIWSSEIKRTYQADFEVYDERSKDWNDAEVDVFVSIEG